MKDCPYIFLKTHLKKEEDMNEWNNEDRKNELIVGWMLYL